jgi:hypothetical protein
VPGAPAAQPTPISHKPSSAVAGIKKSRPIDEDVLNIEPLTERSDVRILSDPIRDAPLRPAEKPATASRAQPISYSPLYDNPPEEPVPATVLAKAEPLPPQKPAATSFFSRLFPSKSKISSSRGEPPLPQKRKGISGFKPGKGVTMGLGAILIIFLVIIIGAYFIYPMVIGGGSHVVPGPTQTVVTPTPAVRPTATQVLIPEKTPQPVPATGIYVHVAYLGGWKGSYGIPSALQSVINSGDRFYEVENATSTVNATIEKLDGSTRHPLTVEIYKDGKVLTKGETTAGYGKVAVSVNVATGVAQGPLTSTGTKPATTPSTNVTTVKTTAQPTTKLTTLTTTAPVTTTTTSSH